MPRTATSPAHQLGRYQPVSYQLHIKLAQPLSLTVGRLGRFFFPEGNYVYTGSARRHLEARIARHLRREKILRWHIDWLLAAPGVRVIAVTRSALAECTLNQRTGGRILVSGFGASDCCERCDSHLRFLASERAASVRAARESISLNPGAPASILREDVLGSAGLRRQAFHRPS